MGTRASDVTLKQTSSAFPEQYDAYVDGKVVAYLRLRSGPFTVQCPHPYTNEDQSRIDGFIDGFLSETVYIADDVGYGEFDDEETRERELGKAREAIAAWVDRRDVDAWTPARPPQPPLTEEQKARADKALSELMRCYAPPAEVLLRDRPSLKGDFEIPKRRK